MKKTLLKDKNYMLLIIGNLVSLLGSNIQQFVLSLYVLQKTGSATLFASMLAISILPRLILSPIAGVFGDWFNRKKMIVLLDFINTIVLLIFGAIMLWTNDLSIGLIYLLIIILETTEIFFDSAMSAVLPSIIEKDNLLEANSFRTMIISFGQLMAPVLGALIFGAFGLLVAIMINAISYLLSAISELFIKIPKTIKDTPNKSFKVFKEDLIEGLRVVKNNKSIRTIIAVAIIINFSISPLFSVGLIYIIKEILLASDMQFGIFQTVLTASMLIAPIIVTSRLKNAKLGNILTKSYIIIALLVTSLALSTTPLFLNISSNNLVPYFYIMVIVFICVLIVGASNIIIITLFQKIVPLEYMSRASMVLGLMVTIAIPVGQMIFGFLYDSINTSLVIIINGTIILFGVLYHYKNLKAIENEPENNQKTKISEESYV